MMAWWTERSSRTVAYSARPDMWGPGLEVWVYSFHDPKHVRVADWSRNGREALRTRAGYASQYEGPGVAEAAVLAGLVTVAMVYGNYLDRGQWDSGWRAWTPALELAAEFDPVSHPR